MRPTHLFLTLVLGFVLFCHVPQVSAEEASSFSSTSSSSSSALREFRRLQDVRYKELKQKVMEVRKRCMVNIRQFEKVRIANAVELRKGCVQKKVDKSLPLESRSQNLKETNAQHRECLQHVQKFMKETKVLAADMRRMCENEERQVLGLPQVQPR